MPSVRRPSSRTWRKVGRGPDQLGDGVGLLELGHVKADEGPLRAEEDLGQGLGQLGLAHAALAHEEEAGRHPGPPPKAHPGPAEGARQGADRLLLAHHPLSKLLLQVHELFVVLVVHVDPAPGVHHGLNVLPGDHRGAVLLLGHGEAQGSVEADPAGGLVNEVNGLVGEVAPREGADADLDGKLQDLVGDDDPMVGLVAGPEALQDLQGLLGGGLQDDDGLEAPLQGGVFFYVAVVLPGGGGPDDLDLAPGQGGLEDVGGVQGALGPAGADQGVELVNEGDDLGVFELLNDLAQALLKLAPVLGARHHPGQVNGHHPGPLEDGGDPALHDGLGQPFHDGGLAHPGVPDEHRVVLGAAGQDLDHPVDLLLAADHRVQLPFPGLLGEVAAVLVQERRVHGLFPLAVIRHGQDAPADGVHVLGEVGEDAVGDPVPFADDAQEDVLGADHLGPHVAGLGAGQLHDPPRPGRDGGGFPGAAPLAAAHQFLHHAAHGLEARPVLLEDAGRRAPLAHQAQEEVLRADHGVA
jgi:hypothetical protein